MGLIPEREPRQNIIERPDEASPLNVERKEVVTPVVNRFKPKNITDDNGQQLIESVDDKRFTIEIPEPGQESMEATIKGDKEDQRTWKAAQWYRILKKAIYFGWKVVFGS